MSGSDGARGADLWEVFSVVPDHRRAEGKRYPPAGLLMIALAAMLAGGSGQLGVVRWGRKLSREALAELGILRGRVPGPSVWSELFRALDVGALDVGALERLLGAWVKGAGVAGHVAIDGKRLRGSAVGDVPGVHLLAAFSERLQGVIGQLRVVLSGLAPASITCALGRTMASCHAASRMASTVMARRRNWSLRQSAGTCW